MRSLPSSVFDDIIYQWRISRISARGGGVCVLKVRPDMKSRSGGGGGCCQFLARYEKLGGGGWHVPRVPPPLDPLLVLSTSRPIQRVGGGGDAVRFSSFIVAFQCLAANY